MSNSALALMANPTGQYPRQFKPFDSETAKAASAKGNARMKELRDFAKAHKLVNGGQDQSNPEFRARIAHCKRTLRKALMAICATTSSSEALEWVRVASQVFEIECTLTGRKLTKGQAGKPPGKLKPTDELPLPMELPPSDMPPLDESTLPPKLTSEPIEPASES